MSGGLVLPAQVGAADRQGGMLEVFLQHLFPELLRKLSLKLLLGTFLPLYPLGPDVQIVLLGAADGLGEEQGGNGE